jgi:glycine C-acetyltransferase/8-amino-7-oxononanoate synthase
LTAAVAEFGVGAGASRLVSGTQSPHVRLEAALAKWKGTQAALAFSSGYATAVGTLPALAGKQDVVLLDKLAHASLIDGAKLSGATIRVFPHNHLGKLESHLEWAKREHPDSRVVIVTESVFSMGGDRAPLRELVGLKKRFGALLLLDERMRWASSGHMAAASRPTKDSRATSTCRWARSAKRSA